MQISMRWLDEWVKTGAKPQALGDELTLVGLEVSSITQCLILHKKIVVGEIVDCYTHPLRSNLKICIVAVGRSRPVKIVCGAQNARRGIKTPTALPGAVFPSGEKVRVRSIFQHVSAGILCSSSEIGIDDVSDGILELDDTAAIGDSVSQHLELDDTIIDVELTPNRGDCLSILGIAREVAAIRGIQVDQQDPSNIPSSIRTKIPITVDAIQDAPRYVGRVVKNLDLANRTPDWMKERLRRCGLRSISPVVDITNFVMLELGQPLHAFDLEAVREGVVVRHARAGESLVLLDETQINLLPGTLIIANQEKPIGLAGIMGGQASGVTTTTQSIFIEAAYFSPEIIGTSAREYGLQTDASYRFERGVDPSQQRRALARASDLVVEICGGQLGPISEVSKSSFLPKSKSIVLRRERLDQVLGVSIKEATVGKILSDLNLLKAKYAGGWKVKSPDYRFDIDGEHDVIEEVARLFGFGNIPNRLPRIMASRGLGSEKEMPIDSLENYLVNQDFNEVITYSFVDKIIQERLAPKSRDIEIKNPIASNMNVMRSSLWPGLLQSVGTNYRRQVRRIRLFETGNIFYRKAGEVVERPKVGAVACGSWRRSHWSDEPSQIDFFDMKGAVAGLLNLDGMNRVYEYIPTEHSALHPGQSAEIRFGRQTVGFVGLLHPSIQKFLELEIPVYLFEVDLLAISERHLPSYSAISRFPSVTRDLSIVIKDDVPAIEVEQIISTIGGHLVTSVTLFDVYSGKGVKKYYKSLSFSLTLQSSSRNLTDKEVEAILNKIVAALQEKGGRLRPGLN